jgi:hypothetical protein
MGRTASVKSPAFYHTGKTSPLGDAAYIDTLTDLEHINGQGLAQGVLRRVIH